MLTDVGLLGYPRDYGRKTIVPKKIEKASASKVERFA